MNPEERKAALDEAVRKFGELDVVRWQRVTGAVPFEVDWVREPRCAQVTALRSLALVCAALVVVVVWLVVK